MFKHSRSLRPASYYLLPSDQEVMSTTIAMDTTDIEMGNNDKWIPFSPPTHKSLTFYRSFCHSCIFVLALSWLAQ